MAGIPASTRKEQRLRFAAHPPAQWRASPRSHRMPCGDIPGRVHVSVTGVSAGRATEESGFDRDDPESFIPAGLAPGGLAVGTGEVVHHRMGEVSQGLLLHHLAAATQPVGRGAGLGQLDCLCAVAGCALAAGAPPGLLLDGQVPHIPGVGAMLGEDDLLRWRWHHPVPGHESNLITTADISGEVKRRFLPSLKAGVATPRIP
jgi:hypothetical protein